MSSTKQSPLKGRKVSAEAIAKRKHTMAMKRARLAQMPGEIPLEDIPDVYERSKDVHVPERGYKRKPYTKKKDPRMAAVVQMLRFATTMLEDM